MHSAPSLGVLFTKLSLRFRILGRMIRAVAPPCARMPTLAGLQHYVLYGGAGCDVELIVQFQYALIYGLDVLD